MATVNLAAGEDRQRRCSAGRCGQTLIVCSVLNVLFAATSGLWGVLVTDFIQFGIAMTGSFAAAYFALRQPEVGGLAGLLGQDRSEDALAASGLRATGGWRSRCFIMPLTVQWWSVWYPGAEPGGGSYIAQRMLAAKTERDALGRHALLQRRALRAPAVAVDHRRACARCSCFRPWPTSPARFRTSIRALIGNDMAYPAMLTFLPSGVSRPDGRRSSRRVLCRRSRRTSTGARRTWCTTSIAGSFGRRETERHYVLVGRVMTAAC